MKKLILSVLLSLMMVMPAYAAPFVYFNWTAPTGTSTSDYKVILNGLPDSPIEVGFTSASQEDATYFKADYDLQGLPDGSYTLTGKIKNKWAQESPESDPYPFVKAVPGGISNVHLDF